MQQYSFLKTKVNLFFSEMLNLSNINDSAVEKFSLNRKLALQLLVRLQTVGTKDLKWMIQNTKGDLRKGLLRYKKSPNCTEEICGLAVTLAIDEQELHEVEKAIIKSLKKLED